MILKPRIKKVKKLKRVNPRRLDLCYAGLTEMIKYAEKCYNGEHISLRGNTPRQVFVELKWYLCYIYSLELNNTPLDNLELVNDILIKKIGTPVTDLASGIECFRSNKNLCISLKIGDLEGSVVIKYNQKNEEVNIVCIT